MSDTHKNKVIRDWNKAINDAEFKRALARFKCSYMSNSKWARLFAVAGESGLVQRCTWQQVIATEPFDTSLIDAYEIAEGYFDCMNGAFAMLEFEWVTLHTDDHNGLRDSLAAAGQFCMEDTEAGIKVFGYQ